MTPLRRHGDDVASALASAVTLASATVVAVAATPAVAVASAVTLAAAAVGVAAASVVVTGRRPTPSFWGLVTGWARFRADTPTVEPGTGMRVMAWLMPRTARQEWLGEARGVLQPPPAPSLGSSMPSWSAPVAITAPAEFVITT
jgi:hypothetical protein